MWEPRPPPVADTFLGSLHVFTFDLQLFQESFLTLLEELMGPFPETLHPSIAAWTTEPQSFMANW